MIEPPFDPRSIANLMLDEAERVGTGVTNLAIQKLLYFAHGIFLSKMKARLVVGHFEAWQFGPVHPVVYRAFQTAGKDPISFRAQSKDPLTGELRAIPEPNHPVVRLLVAQVIHSYGGLSPGRLVDLAHARNSPWDFVVDRGRATVALGMRIPDNVIVERFKYHKVSVGPVPLSGEPSEDAPLA